MMISTVLHTAFSMMTRTVDSRGERCTGMPGSAQAYARLRDLKEGSREALGDAPRDVPGLSTKLAVKPQQVVLGETEATDRRAGFQATMWPVPIVAMEPVAQLSRSLIRMVIRASVGPFAQCCLNEAFGLSVSLWGVGAW